MDVDAVLLRLANETMRAVGKATVGQVEFPGPDEVADITASALGAAGLRRLLEACENMGLFEDVSFVAQRERLHELRAALAALAG
jgi:hypothetical protein